MPAREPAPVVASVERRPNPQPLQGERSRPDAGYPFHLHDAHGPIDTAARKRHGSGQSHLDISSFPAIDLHEFLHISVVDYVALAPDGLHVLGALVGRSAISYHDAENYTDDGQVRSIVYATL